MYRHLLLAVVRLILAVVVAEALPLAHAYWGEANPGDGQQAFGIIVLFELFGIVVATIYCLLGTIVQVFLRHHHFRYTLVFDVVVGTLLASLLIYSGITAHYTVSPSGIVYPLAYSMNYPSSTKYPPTSVV